MADALADQATTSTVCIVGDKFAIASDVDCVLRCTESGISPMQDVSERFDRLEVTALLLAKVDAAKSRLKRAKTADDKAAASVVLERAVGRLSDWAFRGIAPPDHFTDQNTHAAQCS